jgi:hypothetical protein
VLSGIPTDDSRKMMTSSEVNVDCNEVGPMGVPFVHMNICLVKNNDTLLDSGSQMIPELSAVLICDITGFSRCPRSMSISMKHGPLCLPFVHMKICNPPKITIQDYMLLGSDIVR